MGFKLKGGMMWLAESSKKEGGVPGSKESSRLTLEIWVLRSVSVFVSAADSSARKS